MFDNFIIFFNKFFLLDKTDDDLIKFPDVKKNKDQKKKQRRCATMSCRTEKTSPRFVNTTEKNTILLIK